jgi:hypothetical protein
MPDELVVIRIFHYRHEAELARSALAADGIESSLMADDAGSQGLGIQFIRGVKVLVREDDRARAEEILGGVEALADEPAEE